MNRRNFLRAHSAICAGWAITKAVPVLANTSVAGEWRTFEVTTNGPILSLRHPGFGHMFFGNFVLHIPFLPAKYRLEQFANIAFGDLPEHVGRAADHFPELTWPAIGANCYSRVTRDELHIWFGHSANEAEAVLTVRPIPRSELGV